MTRPVPPSARPPAGPDSPRTASMQFALLAGAALCLGVITLVYPGATRMHATPWSLLYDTTLLLPVLALVLRSFDAGRAMTLPPFPWRWLAFASIAVIAGSALLSPHRASAWLGSAPLLAAFAVWFLVYDWLHADPARTARRRELARNALLTCFALVAVVSLVLWFNSIGPLTGGEVLAVRNLCPLGHANYTAGLALLMLPTATVMVYRRRGRWQIAAATVGILALLLLFTSGSRGGFLGLAVLAIAAWVAAPVGRRRKWQFAMVGGLAALVFVLAHPRTRAMFLPTEPGAAPNLSNVQREAMLVAGWRMGLGRPVLGWGPGTTPLVFPRYRAGLDGGVENVLQFHSLPAQVWAELGGAGVICLLALAGLVASHARRDPASAAALAGYAVFALTDWQIDVPIFAGLTAVLAAQVAPPPTPPRKTIHLLPGLVAVAGLAGFLRWAQTDPAPLLNSRALALARDPAQAAEAAALLRESLAFNPDQEIAHFNLGWLQLVTDPKAAEHHFLAALHLVPDKGGGYFGLALARLNQGRSSEAAHALAMECLNDPAWIASPWWNEPAVAALRAPATAELARLITACRKEFPAGSWRATQLLHLAAEIGNVGRVPPGPERSYRRERTGYPVLMRNLDLPIPVDLFDVRESVAPAAAPLPPKGWLPAPLLLSLLDPPPAK